MTLPTVPANIQLAAEIILNDLVSGPTYTFFKPGTDEIIGWCFTLDLEEGPYVVEQSYMGRCGQLLHDFISDLPTIYKTEDGEYTEDEPCGFTDYCLECDGTGEVECSECCGIGCEECNDTGVGPCLICDGTGEVYYPPEPYRELSQRQLVALLFGETIAREFV